MLNRHEIFLRLAEHQDTLKKMGVQRLRLFGSAARNDLCAGSDIDFLVDFEQKTFDAYMNLKLFLENLFDHSIDLVITETLKPRLREKILQEAVHAPEL